jgi:hypothetical protein
MGGGDTVLLIGHTMEYQSTALMGLLLREPSLHTLLLWRLMSLQDTLGNGDFCADLKSKEIKPALSVIIVMLTRDELLVDDIVNTTARAAIPFVRCLREWQPHATILLQGPRCRDQACAQTIKANIVQVSAALALHGLGSNAELPAAVARALLKIRHLVDPHIYDHGDQPQQQQPSPQTGGGASSQQHQPLNMIISQHPTEDGQRPIHLVAHLPSDDPNHVNTEQNDNRPPSSFQLDSDLSSPPSDSNNNHNANNPLSPSHPGGGGGERQHRMRGGALPPNFLIVPLAMYFLWRSVRNERLRLANAAGQFRGNLHQV